MTLEQITVATSVPVSQERAWELYTNPDDVRHWNFANDDWHCPSASTDLRVGGAYTARMEAKDGSFGFDFAGVFAEVEAPRSLMLVLGDGRKSRTTFEPAPGGTRVETTFDAEAQNPVEMQRSGWQAILENYRRHAEQASGG